ncbi:MAG TPA: N-acetyl sugar amidotransferase [Bacteroidia bacterium]|jgi:N-acetyl sugar amidotransferase|nr:N-acetyl sugar amidotransferase [Bacteroidia bacterium]
MITCKRCIMDNVNDPDLILDANGICNHCDNFDNAMAKLPKGEAAKKHFDEIIKEIKEAGKGKKYDCIIGVSGGVDSTYLAWVAKQNGLRALLVHCDNGWNSELSVKNIENICSKTGFDLYTLVLDWEEIKDIQLSFLKAGVVDIELPYDYALILTSYKAAIKFRIKHVLTGHNVITEGTYLPKSWRHAKMDIVNIKAIHKQFGRIPFKTFPSYSFITQAFINKKLKYVYLLNYTDYDKKTVKELITKELGWLDYGGKHYENVFTRFYQGYILVEKFKFDKRQFHFSVLVQAGQISRQEALKEYALPAYDAKQCAEDKDYALKKLGITEEEFETYMKAPIKKHTDYQTLQKYWDIYFKAIKIFKPFKKLIAAKK